MSTATRRWLVRPRESHRAQPCRYTLPAGLSTLTPAALGASRESTAPTFRLRTRLVHVEQATFKVGAIQSRDCPIRLGRIRHLDESEAARMPRVTVRHQVHTTDFSVCLEKRSHRRLGCGKIQIAYVDVFHVPASFCLSIVRARQGRSEWPSSGRTFKRHYYLISLSVAYSHVCCTSVCRTGCGCTSATSLHGEGSPVRVVGSFGEGMLSNWSRLVA